MESAKPRAAHLAFGANGENVAAAFMAGRGYAILARNWRHGHLELDLVCEKNGEIIFVEVKTRRSALYGGGVAAVNTRKQRKLLAASQFWLMENKMWGSPCRFDVICLYGQGRDFRMEHYRNAFCQTLANSHPYW